MAGSPLHKADRKGGLLREWTAPAAAPAGWTTDAGLRLTLGGYHWRWHVILGLGGEHLDETALRGTVGVGCSFLVPAAGAGSPAQWNHFPAG